MRKLLLVSIVCLLAVGATAGAGVAQARLDRSFGQDGVVDVRPPLPAPWAYQFIHDLAGARDGSSFALFERQYCAGQAGCFSANVLFRYLADGSLDPAFGGPGGAYELPKEGVFVPTLAVDSRGRPLLAQASASSVVIRRLTSSGAPDPGFGANGAVALGCDCSRGATQLVPGPAGTLTVALPRNRATGTVLRLVRLKADGSRDNSFGRDGSTTFGLRGASPFAASATTRGGALYLGGAGCCDSEIPGYVSRVSASGRFDVRFTAASQRSLGPLRRLRALELSVNAVIVRPGGKIDVLGSAGYENGFIVRLNPSGRVNREFGRNGLRILPMPVASAGLGSEGATLAVSDDNLRGIGVLMRILPSGRLDPAFGHEGEPVPTSAGVSGLAVVPQSGRRALVLVNGLKECRGYCPAQPKLVRFLEGAPRRR